MDSSLYPLLISPHLALALADQRVVIRTASRMCQMNIKIRTFIISGTSLRTEVPIKSA